MSDIVERLNDMAQYRHMDRDNDVVDNIMHEGAQEITRLRQALSEAEKRAEDARRQTLEDAAKVVWCHADDRGGKDRHFDWHDGYMDGCRGAATAIRAMKSEER